MSSSIHPARRAVRGASAALVLGVLLSLATLECAPNARSARCENDGDCPDATHGRAYCVHSRCVECVTSSSCGAHRRCAEGQCVERSG